MSWATEDAEAAWAEHVAECPVCDAALARGEFPPVPGCPEWYDDDDEVEPEGS